jgi:Tol biopolymer transport system component
MDRVAATHREAVMKMLFAMKRMNRLPWLGVLATVALTALPAPTSAQYFGRNKVQFDDFDFQVLETDHFNWHFYPEERDAVHDAIRMGERWYERFARTFQHEFEAPKPVILYANHPDFQQTNTLRGFIGEGTGGVTESLKNRVIMPLTGSYWDTDHVLGHELVHAFQYNIAQSRRGGGLQGLTQLPLWLVEGMAEYFSVGRDDPLTAMWIRDAIRRDDLPTIRQLARPTYFPYRFGQALWAYIGGTYGDDAVVQIYRRSLRVGFEGAIQSVLAMPTDTLSARWKEKVAEEYLPLLEGRQAPAEVGELILAPSTGSGEINISPAMSPDGRYVAFLTQKDLFSIDLFMAEVETGEIIRKLSSADSDPHIEALRYIDSSGTFSPDSRQFAYVAVAGGDNEIVIVNVSNGSVDRRLSFEEHEIGAVTNPAWSPDGRTIVFSGSVGGISDLYLYDLETDEVVQLTNDKYADLQPSWSPDGRTIAFTSDRGPETNFERLTYSAFQLSLIDVATGGIQVLPVFGNVKHINPRYSGDGSSLYFISDQDGFSDVYGLSFQNGAIRRITNVATGVSGHTYLSPAMSLADDGTMAFTVFDEREFHIYTKNVNDPAPTVTVVENPEAQEGRKLPPATPDRFSRIATYLADAETGLLPSGTWQEEDEEEYSSRLSLDYIGQPMISVGTGTDSYGNYVGGATTAYFSDMLGDKILGVALYAQGTFRDIGGTASYTDLGSRWNWTVGAGRIPLLFGGYNPFGIDENGDTYFGLQRLRIYITSAIGRIQYPFSGTERLEFGLGVTRYTSHFEEDRFYDNGLFRREELPARDPLNLAQGSVALVGDNSRFGFVSPIQGSRYRVEFEQTTGSADFSTVIGDFRRYFWPARNLTVGVRVLHYGRYGLSAEEQGEDQFGLLRPLFLGFETLVRGYAWESFETRECAAGATTSNTCPTLNRLYGNKLGVANLELRVPLLGVAEYGLINFPYVPTELVLFGDIGAAADNPFTNDELNLVWSRSSSSRVPVASTGVSARFNILGFLLFEAYYAYPFQRPEKGWHWGFQFAPGW